MKLDYFPPNGKQIEIPPSNCKDLKQLIDFATSFDAYQYVEGGIPAISELYRQVKQCLIDNCLEDVSLEQLRCCLFWRQRAHRWYDDSGTQEYQYWIDLIREKSYKI